MENDVVVTVEGLSKKYCRSLRRSMWYGLIDSVRDVMGRRSHSERLRTGEFWSVDQVSFEVKRGECLGLVGPNGAGKSTLLMMLNGIIRPDRGTIRLLGRTAPLIGVGAGFHPQLTGRENVYVNGAILGLSKAEIDAVFDEIVEFADIGDYLDSPVKFYSSGMYVRLGMAVALHTRPNLLLVDEVFAVGDIRFQSQCLSRIASLRREGTAIILVSHNMDTITGYSDRVLVLDRGRCLTLAPPGQAVDDYMRLMESPGDDWVTEPHADATGDVSFQRVRFLDEAGDEVEEIGATEPLTVMIDYESGSDHEGVELVVGMYDGKHQLFVRSSNLMMDQRLRLARGSGSIRLDFPCVPKNNGRLRVTLTLWARDRHELLEWRPQLSLRVNGCSLSSGHVWIPCSYEVSSSSAARQTEPRVMDEEVSL